MSPDLFLEYQIVDMIYITAGMNVKATIYSHLNKMKCDAQNHWNPQRCMTDYCCDCCMFHAVRIYYNSVIYVMVHY